MPQETTEAVVVRGVDFSETSRIVTLLTPARGKVAVLARGARRKNSPWAAALDTFNRIEVVYQWKDGRGVQTLTDVSMLDAFPQMKRDLDRSACAAFPLEVAYKVAHENEPSEALYAALIAGLAGMDRGDAAPVAQAAWQVLALLRAAGFGPTLDHCVRCGGALPADPTFSWEGGLCCRDCGGDRRLRPETLASLRTMAEETARCPEVAAPNEVFSLMRQFAARQLETDFRSLRVLDQLVGRDGPRAGDGGT